MRHFKKGFLLLLVLAMHVSMVSWHGRKIEASALPSTTSRELGVFVSGKELCDKEGKKTIKDYTLDENGNILNNQGEIVVTAENTEEFSYTTSVYYDRKQLQQTLRGEILESSASAGTQQLYSVLAASDSTRQSETIITEPLTYSFKMTVEPKNTVNSTLTIESRDPGTLFFPHDKNRKNLDADQTPQDNILPAVRVEANNNNQVEVTITAVAEGNTDVTVKNVTGETIDTLQFEFNAVVDEGVKKSESEKHEHIFANLVVAPTTTAKGYTLHTCKECGYSFKDTYTDMLTHTHDFEDKVIPPTYTAKGYTIHTCKVCGETLRDAETHALVCQHENMKTTIIEPTCESKGYTLHECTTCKIYSYKDSETDPLGHNWNGGVVTKQSSCTEEGVSTYTCTRCGDTKTEKIDKTSHYYKDEIVPATYTTPGYTRHYCVYCGQETEHTDITPITEHIHSYYETVQQATCTESGYVKHTCGLCGDIYTDQKVDALGHSYSERVMIQPTCITEGVVAHVCDRCGNSYETKTPALGHSYAETVVESTEASEGYTEHYCSRCGDTYKDNYTPKITPQQPVQPQPQQDLVPTDELSKLQGVEAAGNNWLISNGYTVGGVGGNCAHQFAMKASDSQQALEGQMLLVAQTNVRAAMKRVEEKEVLIGAEFYCEAKTQGDLVILSCWYSFVADPDYGWRDIY